MENIQDVATKTFAVLGALWLGSKVLSYVQLLLSLFVLPGKDVGVPARIRVP